MNKKFTKVVTICFCLVSLIQSIVFALMHVEQFDPEKCDSNPFTKDGKICYSCSDGKEIHCFPKKVRTWSEFTKDVLSNAIKFTGAVKLIALDMLAIIPAPPPGDSCEC